MKKKLNDFLCEYNVLKGNKIYWNFILDTITYFTKLSFTWILSLLVLYKFAIVSVLNEEIKFF